MTQFFFEAEPFLQWVGKMRAAGVQARLVGGLVGTTRLTTLFKFAARCGAGPSIRALGERPGSLLKLIGEQGPERVMRDKVLTRTASGKILKSALRGRVKDEISAHR